MYYEKHADEYKEYSGFIGKTKCRSTYITLPDREKLQYIKKSEAKFDSLKVKTFNIQLNPMKLRRKF